MSTLLDAICPKCGQMYPSKEYDILECPKCGAEGSEFCCNCAGEGCLCNDCDEREEEE
jgi:exosome complex RNA-binding protein Csl4